MAKIEIKEMNKIEKQSGRMQEVVEATYSMVNSINGELFQIDTYGRNSRMNTGTASQTIQFDRESAKKLIKILIEEFSLLD